MNSLFYGFILVDVELQNEDAKPFSNNCWTTLRQRIGCHMTSFITLSITKVINFCDVRHIKNHNSALVCNLFLKSMILQVY